MYKYDNEEISMNDTFKIAASKAVTAVLIGLLSVGGLLAQTRKAVAPVSPTYSQLPFDPHCVRLPTPFMGNNIVRLCKDYEALSKTDKGEFETNADFNKRIELAETKFYMGNETITLAFVVPMVSEYDADAQVFNVGVECSGRSQVKHVSLSDRADGKGAQAIPVTEHATSKTYVASNAFGANVPVESTEVESFYIGVRNREFTDNFGGTPIASRLESKFCCDVLAREIIVSSIAGTPNEARRIKSTLAALAICSIQRGDTIISDDFVFYKPTFDDPKEGSEQMHFLNAELLAVWFFDSSSGKIYAKVGPKP